VVGRRQAAASEFGDGSGGNVRSIRSFAARTSVSIFILAGSAMAQQGQTPRLTLSTGQASNAASAEASGHPVPYQRNPRYRINRSDILSISFPITPEFNQPKVMVQPDGYITLQGAGSLYVQNLSVPEAVEAVKKAYSKTLHEPIVDIDLIDFQRPYFVVLGQVGEAGAVRFALRHDGHRSGRDRGGICGDGKDASFPVSADGYRLAGSQAVEAERYSSWEERDRGCRVAPWGHDLRAGKDHHQGS